MSSYRNCGTYSSIQALSSRSAQSTQVTRETARLFGRIAEDMERRGAGGERLARYLNQIVFCLYAEDAGLLRENLFTDIVERQYRNPNLFNIAVKNLFAQMASGGLFGSDVIARFNGDLFNESDTWN